MDKVPVLNRFSLKPREGPSPQIRKFLEQNKDMKIDSIYIGREPVQSGVQSFVNALSLGGYNKMKKKLGYEDVYHSFLVVRTKDGKLHKVEKNHVVQQKEISPEDISKAEVKNIPLNRELSIGELIENGSKNDKEFYKYDPEKRNCQWFVNDVIKDNGLDQGLNKDTEELLNPQDGTTLLSSLGKLKGVPKVLTDLAAGGDRLIHGNGIRKGKGITVDELFSIANRRK